MHRHPVLDHLQRGSTWDAGSKCPSADVPLGASVEHMFSYRLEAFSIVTVQSWVVGFAKGTQQAYRADMRDLYHATRDDLIQIIRQQDEVIADQARRLAAQQREIEDLRQTVASLTEQVGTAVGRGRQRAGIVVGRPEGDARTATRCRCRSGSHIRANGEPPEPGANG